MKRLHFLIVFALQIGIVSAYGQIDFTNMDLASSDSLQKNRISHFSPGIGGKSKVWNFSRKLNSKEAAQVLFKKDSTGVVSVIECGKISYYRNTLDTLILIGSETPLEKREYALRMFSKTFPLEYGDSLTMPFRCEGTYCGEYPFREVGTTTVKVDAEGSIVLAENDTLRNVRRVHTINSYSICMDRNYEALDSARLTQVIDERYEWYLPGSQYPIIENVSSTTYFNMDIIGTTKYAYCNLPDVFVPYYIKNDDESEAYNEQEDFSEEEQQSPDIIHYQVGTQGKEINITYNLDEYATITVIVANHMGMLCMSRQWTQDAGHGYSAQIGCYGLKPGMYILYINVNGKVYSEKVTL